MLRYTLKRLLQMIPTVIGVMLITFILFFIVPNDLAAIALGKQANAKRLQEFDTKRGLDKPLFSAAGQPPGHIGIQIWRRMPAAGTAGPIRAILPSSVRFPLTRIRR